MKSNWVAKASAVDEIKTFDNDDKAVKRSFSLRMFCGLVIIIKNFNFINSRRPSLAAEFDFTSFSSQPLFSSWLLVLHQGCFGYTRGVLVEI